jgi:hypothetical protein
MQTGLTSDGVMTTAGNFSWPQSLGLLGLGLLWLLGGIVAPLKFIPLLLGSTPLAPTHEAVAYVYLADPNVRSSDEAIITLDDPSQAYTFNTVSYSCVEGLELSLVTNSEVHLPCGEAFHVDGFSKLTLEPLSVHDAAVYVQLEITLIGDSGIIKSAHPVLKIYPSDAALDDPLPMGVAILAE